MPGFAATAERHQVAVYLGALVAGFAAGWAAPAAASWFEHAINPVLALLLYVTFLQVPVAELGRSLRAGRFLAAALVVNFALVPLVVAALLPLVPADQAVRLGVLLVLLTPCVDYVIVFSGLAGADGRLLAATPLLLIAQLVLLPGYLLLFLGPGAAVVDPGPFAEAFVVLIAIPLTLAWLTQSAPKAATVANALSTTMVPLMAATLFVVVASQVPKLGDDLPLLARVVPIYVVFLVVMAFAGRVVARAFRLDTAGARAIVFTGATRNSLVVLPLALALPGELAAAVVVTQTLVEVVGMVVYVRAVPRLLP
ncbi:bile acid:sodium symporter [Lentzea sp. DG1S-22]|uniref:bile acid:sodium symporter n=1 Tax=Lentzea sp. DG1S-22 TaxID=3108822 RepID=UPI002E78782A|nr:bile acid:sodium symporter [Lentzea sp. DG1S-22]WVH82510.1 bile acid:sodium symporter [Lentzea sp. DG1S-22]